LNCELPTDTSGVLFNNGDAFDEVAWANGIDNLDTIDHLAETGVYTVKVLSVLTVVADEELRATSVPASMSHGKHSSVVVLTLRRGLALYCPTRSTRTNTRVTEIAAIRTSTLYDKIRNDTMETQSIIEARLGEFHKIGNRIWCFFLVKLDFHRAFCGLYYSV